MGKLAYSGRLMREFVGFAMTNKAYWIIPLLFLLVLISLLIVTSQAATPFIYTLF